ncbi:hypothetical protein ACHAWO_013884 [Cyclotella atomus]|jgi:hypothetical protein|uniref:Uncharacterized protein n=1 Tax=Cyclotella atomus TaxID=382360 RepID=A0ABD3QUQ3_9STRA
MKKMISKLTLLLACCLHTALSFSTIPSSDIKIVGLPGGNIESLPGMYVQSFQRWIVHEDNTNKDECILNIEPMKGTGYKNEEGWVNPTSTNDLWWPADVSIVQTRPMLNVLFKSGVLSYISVGLDVRVPHLDETGTTVTWRNYGLKTQPIARQWTTLDIAMEKLFHVEGFVLYNTNDEEKENEQEEMFESSVYAEPILEKVATFIAQMDQDSPLSKGFHIVSFPMSKLWVDLPRPKTTSADADKEPVAAYKLVCFATSEPFASKLLGMDEGLLEMSSTSVLEVDVSLTEEGSKSQYLPEVYKRLYLKQ